MWQSYQRLIKQKPLLTASATGWIVMFFGDLIAQTIQSKSGINNNQSGMEGRKRNLEWVEYDFRRTFCMGSWSGAIMAPTFLLWFKKLDRIFPGNSLRSATLKVLSNHIVVAVPFNALALAYTVTSENLLAFALDENVPFDMVKNINEIEHRCKSDLLKLFIASSAVWIPVNMCNFLFCPPHLRVLPTIFTSLVWNTFLSHTAHEILE
jgi:hypothetical protein